MELKHSDARPVNTHIHSRALYDQSLSLFCSNTFSIRYASYGLFQNFAVPLSKNYVSMTVIPSLSCPIESRCSVSERLTINECSAFDSPACTNFMEDRHKFLSFGFTDLFLCEVRPHNSCSRANSTSEFGYAAVARSTEQQQLIQQLLRLRVPLYGD